MAGTAVPGCTRFHLDQYGPAVCFLFSSGEGIGGRLNDVGFPVPVLLDKTDRWRGGVSFELISARSLAQNLLVLGCESLGVDDPDSKKKFTLRRRRSAILTHEEPFGVGMY